MFENVLAFHRPRSISEAVKLLASRSGEARYVAGGTDIISQGDRSIRFLVDLSQTGLNYIRHDKSWLVIGATTPLIELEDSPLVRSFAGGILSEAAVRSGTVQLRNMATIGGKVVAGGLTADLLTPLVALDALAVVESGGTRRSIPLATHYRDLREACLDGGLLVDIHIPPAHTGAAWAYERHSRTEKGVALATVAAGVIPDAKGNAIWTSVAVNGMRLDGRLHGDAVAVRGDFRASAGYRRHLATVLIRKVLQACSEKGRLPS